MTLSDLKWPFHASRAISAVAELLVNDSKAACMHTMTGSIYKVQL